MTNRNQDDERERFLRGRARPDETRERVRAALLGKDDPEPWQPAATAPDDYAGVLDRARAAAASLAAAVEEEERHADAAVAELEDLPEDAWDDLVQEQERFHSWAGVRALSRASLEVLNDQPVRAAALARQAVVAAEAVPAGEAAGGAGEIGGGERLRADLRALARGRRANAERVASDLRAAEAAFRVAFEERERGTGDPVVHAELESLLASLRSDQGRYGEAVLLADRAARRYRRLGDRHGYGRTRLKQATFHAHQDDLETALETLDEALAHLDAAAEPRLAFAARHNRASYLDRLGRHGEAVTELEAAAGLRTSSLDRVRWTWLSGRLDVHRGRPGTGEEQLRQARDAFLELGIGYDAALVGLELAALYADQGRSRDMRRLAEEMVPVFASRDVHQRAREALEIWSEAARAEAAGQHLVRSLIRYLERARYRPDLAFER